MGNGHPAFFGWVNPPPSPGRRDRLADGGRDEPERRRRRPRGRAPRARGRALAGRAGGLPARARRRAAHERRLGGHGRLPRRRAAQRARGRRPRRAPRRPRRAPRGCSPTCRPRRTAASSARSSCSASAARRCAPRAARRRPARRRRAARRRSPPTGPRGARARRCWSARPAPSTRERSTRSTTLADVAAAEGLWFHVDGAYGAFGVLDPALAPSYRGMERADSLALDPHKWLGRAGRRGLRAGAPRRRPARRVQPDPALPAPGRRGRRLARSPSTGSSRRGRSARSRRGPPIAALGRDGIAAHVARCNELARELATMVEREPELELAVAPQTSIVAFRARPAGCPPERLEAGQRGSAGGGPGARAGRS